VNVKTIFVFVIKDSLEEIVHNKLVRKIAMVMESVLMEHVCVMLCGQGFYVINLYVNSIVIQGEFVEKT